MKSSGVKVWERVGSPFGLRMVGLYLNFLHFPFLIVFPAEQRNSFPLLTEFWQYSQFTSIEAPKSGVFMFTRPLLYCFGRKI